MSTRPNDDADAGSGGAREASGDDRSAAARGSARTPDDGRPDDERKEDSVSSVERIGDFEQFRDDLDAVESKVASEIDPGTRAIVVAGAVAVLLLSMALSHAGTARGFDVLLNTDVARVEHIGLPSQLFVWFLMVFGVGFSALALMTRRWVFAWIAAAGSAVGSVFGMLSIWHRQTPGLDNYQGEGPGLGLILGALVAIVLTFHWVRVVWTRTAAQLAIEEQRRNAAAATEERDRRRFGRDS